MAELYMLVLIPADLARTVDFYRRLGVDIPEDSPGPRIEIRMTGGFSFLIIARGRVPELDDARVLLEFYLHTADAVDSKYHELIAAGYESHHAPWEATTIGTYFATLKDPDGTVVLLSGDPRK